MTGNDLTEQELVDGASLPSRAGIYFVGPYTPRITFYSQQVRALRLARALHKLDRLKANESIAVVGAGAAGATLAIALAMLRYRVVLYDQSEEILHLQSGSSRLLHPHIYEWPQFGSLDDDAGLPVLDWTANRGSQVVLNIRSHFNALQASLAHKLTLDLGQSLKKIDQSGQDWVLTFERGGAEKVRNYSHVFLTMGFGDELPCGPVRPEDYWKPGAVGTSTTEARSGTTYVVSGNGDGALTVVLGLLIKDFDHVAFTHEFLNFKNADLLRDAANEVFRGKGLDEDVESGLRSEVLPILENHGVLDRLQQKLRRDRVVTINSHGPLFAAGKASQLNQCMVFALLEAAKIAGVDILRSQGFVEACEQIEAGVRLSGTVLNGVADCSVYKHAILRHGPDIKARYGAAGGLISEYQVHVRTLIAGNAAYALPPSLDDVTFDLFESERLRLLSPPATLAAELASASARKYVIEVTIDPASSSLVERGCVRIAELSAQCETLGTKHFVDLHASPSQLPDAGGLVRLARSSNKKIELRACKSILAEWNKLDTEIAEAPPRSSVGIISKYPDTSLKYAVDHCLMRLLDRGVMAAVAQGSSPKLGNISTDILEQVAATWTTWKAALNADESKRFDFLRWLANVDQPSPVAWDGNHGSLVDMTNALIMIAATHSGEPLSPDPAINGNLTFGTNGVVIGSGAASVGFQPLILRTSPDEWGADALILAAASGISVSEPLGTVLDAGSTSQSMMAARRVSPAIVQADSRWLRLLSGPLTDWKREVVLEFAEWRRRQDEELLGIDR